MFDIYYICLIDINICIYLFNIKTFSMYIRINFYICNFIIDSVYRNIYIISIIKEYRCFILTILSII